MLIFRGSGPSPGDFLSSSSLWYGFVVNLLSCAASPAVVLALVAVMVLSSRPDADQAIFPPVTSEQPMAMPQLPPATFIERFPQDSRPSAMFDPAARSTPPPEKERDEHVTMHEPEPAEATPGSVVDPIPEARPLGDPKSVTRPEPASEAAPRKSGSQSRARSVERRSGKIRDADDDEPSRGRKIAHKMRPHKSWMAQETSRGTHHRHILHSASSGGELSLPASLRP